jgi:hypothetical protein
VNHTRPDVRPDRRSPSSLCSRVAWVALLAACNDFSPDVGPLANSCSEGSDDASSPYGVSPYGGGVAPSMTSGSCPEGGAQVGTNMVAPDAGVTGNVLVADQLNNRVLVIDRQGNVLFTFGDGRSVPSATSVVAPNDAEYIPGPAVLIAGTGAPMGGEPTCTTPSGCVDDRVLIVDYTSRAITWQFGGHDGGPGSGQLASPASAVLVATPKGDHVLISDQGNGRVVEVDRSSKTILWQYPPIDAGASSVSPQSAERLDNGDTLIADQGGNRIVAVTTGGVVAWQYPPIRNPAALDFPAFASRLPNGNTLIADSNNNRVIEIDKGSPGNIVWSYLATPGESPAPTGAVRLQNGHTLITELSADQVIEVDHSTPPRVVYVHGLDDQGGSGRNQLNQPYNAKVVGDYTGLSTP